VRRSWISRSLASVLALWLAVCLAEPVQLHICVMHGGLAMEQMAAPGMHGHSSTIQHHPTHGFAGHFKHNPNSDNESQQCSCLGDCNSGRAPIRIAAAGVSLPTVAIIEGSATDFAYDTPRIVAPQFLLPFSNGPPAGSSRA
jgi:hypothetical protein